MANLLDTLDPIFAECVGDDDSRYTLTQPWTCMGFVYATDCRIAVREPTTRVITTGKPPPNAWQLFDDSTPTGKPLTLPDIGPELADSTVCEKCNGRKPKKCNTGHGVQPWCSECDGEGTIARERVSIRLHPKHEHGLADYYVWFLQRHGVKSVHKALKGTAFCFRKGKIEGLVMGMTLGADNDA